jgi:GNAT superfamily N-acetyltransferase
MTHPDADSLRQRSATPSDMPYVLATWVRSYGSGIPSARRQQAVADYRRRYVDRIMASDPHIVLLCSPESRNTLHGWCCAIAGGVAWVYVAKDLRRLGLARRLITAALREYPETIRVHCAWPWTSDRFRFEKLKEAA